MSNPVLNEKRLARAASAVGDGDGWGASSGPFVTTGQANGTMTIAGTVRIAAILGTILIAAAAYGWTTVTVTGTGEPAEMTVWPLVAILVGFAAAMGAVFVPKLAKILGPVYSLATGFAVGAISHAYAAQYEAIVLQALLATVAVFVTMLGLYTTGVIKVTEKFRAVVMAATLGVAALYLVSIVVSLFGGRVPYLHEPTLFGIGLSVVISVIAAMNLAVDFDVIERGARNGYPRDTQWVAALGLVVTLVWLYLEMLRLIAKLRSR